MRFNFKRIAAGALALALTASLCGCDNGYIMTVEDIAIRNGVYLSFQQTAYNEAYGKIRERNSDNSDSSDGSVSETDVFKETIEGKSASEWIKAETMKQVRKFAAVQKVCGENGISLTEEEIAEANADLQKSWDEENLYVQYALGFDTLSEYYTSLGIGLESLKEIRRANMLSDKLFMYYYGADGLYPVTEDEINGYLAENYAAVKMLALNYKDYKGNALETDEDKQAVKDGAKAYADRLNGGESFVDVKYDFDLAAARDSARASAESSYAEDNEEGLSEEEYVKKAVDEAEAEKTEHPEDLDTYISKESSSLDEKLTEYIWNAAADGKATVFEGESAAYVVVREDITAKSEWKEKNHEVILKAIKSDEYDGMMELTYRNYDVELDEYLVNTKYDPEKVNKRNTKK